MLSSTVHEFEQGPARRYGVPSCEMVGAGRKRKPHLGVCSAANKVWSLRRSYRLSSRSCGYFLCCVTHRAGPVRKGRSLSTRNISGWRTCERPPAPARAALRTEVAVHALPATVRPAATRSCS